jgi:hypothetical protein
MNEDELCEIFAKRVKEIPSFAAWILLQTKFSDHANSTRLLHEEQMSLRSRKHWWRHWWCYVPELQKESETDVFMVLEAPGSIPFAIRVTHRKQV